MCVCCEGVSERREVDGKRARTNELFVSNLWLSLDKDMTEQKQEALQTHSGALTCIFF